MEDKLRFEKIKLKFKYKFKYICKYKYKYKYEHRTNYSEFFSFRKRGLVPERKGAAKSLFSSEKNEKRKTEFDLLRSNRYLLANHHKFGLNKLKIYWINIPCLEHFARFINALKDKCQIRKRLIGLSKIGVAEAVLQKENQGNPSDNKQRIKSL